MTTSKPYQLSFTSNINLIGKLFILIPSFSNITIILIGINLPKLANPPNLALTLDFPQPQKAGHPSQPYFFIQ
ncbi:hypothetical protein GH733_010806, partial [Mirounga leonina]